MAGRIAEEAVEIDGAAELEAQLRRLEEQEGWINLTPGIPAEAEVDPSRSLFSWLVGAPGPAAPMATWMPAKPGSSKPGQLGVLHARGRLHREGIAGLASIPASWRCTGDHARRGLVFEVDAATSREIAEAMLSVVEELTTVPTTGRYLAEVFLRPA